MQISTQARRYRATLIPSNIELDDVEAHAARGMLPTLRIKADDAESAAETAHRVSGKRVLKVERLEEVASRRNTSPDVLLELKATTFLLHSACLVIKDPQARRIALAQLERSRAAIAHAAGNAA